MEPQEEGEDQLILEAEERLRQKQADYDTELRTQHQLLRQINLLESVAKQDSLPDVMHRMTLQTLTLTATTAAATAEAATTHAAPAPAQQQPQQPTSPPAPAPAHAPPLQLEDVPLSMSAFDEKLLQRVADMTLEDCIAMYTAFVKKNQFAVTHVKCHGDASYLRQEMCDSVTRICNVLLLLGFLLLPLMSRLLSLNFITLQEDEAPAGWYARVAQVIPVHADFAALVQAGVACAQSSVSREFDSSGDVLQQLRRAIHSQEPSAEHALGDLGGLDLDNLDGLLDKFNRCANSVVLLRSMCSVYLFAAMQRIFHPVVLGETFISCWPYSIRGLVILEEYLKRDDVQAVIQPSHGGTATSTTSILDSNSDLNSGCASSPTRSAYECDSTSGSVCN